jgi:hypothetical protein
MRWSVLLFACPLVACLPHDSTHDERKPVSATYWLRSDAVPPPESQTNPDHPCGATATVALLSVPVGPGPLEPEYVREIDPQGRVLRAWPVPIDRLPLAVSGHALFLSEPGSTNAALVVGAGGELATAFGPASRPPKPFRCPRQVLPINSDYLRCASVVDLETGVARLLAFEGPCT